MRTFEGSLVALATPFRNDALDEAAYRKLIRYQLDNATTGLVAMGTTGEAATMSSDERSRAIAIAVEMAGSQIPVIAGAGSNGTQQTIDQVREVRALGVDGALIVTPFYNKPTQAGLVEHYRLIARAHPGFPLIAYNVPSRTGVDLLPETCARLCDIPEVVAIKEATGSMARAIDIVERCADRLTLLSGDDFTVLPFIACGGKGSISVSANVAPRLMADLIAAAVSGDIARARTLQVAMNALHRLLFIEPNPIPVKWALHQMDLFGPDIRPPLMRMTEDNAGKLRDELIRLKLMPA